MESSSLEKSVIPKTKTIENSKVFQPVTPGAVIFSENRWLKKRGYLIKSIIGEGSYSKVKKAFSVKLVKNVALKIVDRTKVPKTFKDKFLPREIEILTTIRHPNIVRVHEIFESQEVLSQSTVFFVTEFMQCGDLLEHIKTNGNMKERNGCVVFRNLLQAISYLHKNGIVHRDIKCENVLLDVDKHGKFVAKICDFGFARHIEDSASDQIQYSKGSSKNLTRTFCGSAAYAAPEVLMSRPHDSRAADVWACGVVAFITLYGRMPYDDTNIDEMIKIQLGGALPRTDVIQTPQTQAVIKAALNPDPTLRSEAHDLLNDKWFKPGRTQQPT